MMVTVPREHEAACRETLERLRRSKRVVAFSGAGISKESGIPTFRDQGGLWENYRVEDVATPEGFRTNPALVWDFYLARRRGAAGAEPNAAHLAIAAWEKKIPFVGVVTQNIDGLHARAGSTRIQELHGNIWTVRCTGCERLTREEILERSTLPHCGLCGALLRPHIVWFGEPLDPEVIERSLEWMRAAEIIFVIGTSGVVEPAAGFVRDAARHGAFIVEVNVEETALSHAAHVSLFGRSAEVLGDWLKLV
jgi:NAD-dependent deacetylase